MQLYPIGEVPVLVAQNGAVLLHKLAMIALPLAALCGLRNEQMVGALVVAGSSSAVSCFIMAKNMGIINDIKENLTELEILTEPASIEADSAKRLTPEERDIRRAELIRSKL